MRRPLKRAGLIAVVGGLGWAAYAGVAWLRYGRLRRRGTGGGSGDPLDRFLPDPEVDERHETAVAAPAAVSLAAAKELDLQRSPVVHVIFALRELPARLRGQKVRWAAPGLVEETLAIGWGVLLDVPDEVYIAGAVTQPWKADVEFRALPPAEFAAFDEPGYAKIVWTLEAETLSERESLLRTRTRVKTTDPVARKLFRRYWSVLSPGILLIRYEALRLIRRDARSRAEANATVPPRGARPGA
jgi:hypothetical protein